MQEITISKLFAHALAGWRTPVVFAAILVAYTLLSLSGARPIYRVTMTVVPAPADQSAPSSSSSTSALGAILGMGAGGNVNFGRYQKLLSSTVVAQRLQTKYNMLQYVFRSYWDPQRKIWVPRPTMRNYLLDWLLRWSNLPTFSAPDTTALASYLQNEILVVPGTNNDIVTITMDNPDVAFATHVLLTAHEQANQVLRDQIARRAQQQVAYLENKLNQTSVEDYRATLLNILGNQQKTLMLTQTNASYAAEILSPPIASPTPVGPRPVLSMFLAVFIGTLAGLCVVIFLGPDWWHSPYARLLAIGRRLRSGAGTVPN